VETGQKSEYFGAHPTGFISYGSDCRVQVIMISEKRKVPANLVPTDAERIGLYNGLTAYAGTYSITGGIVSHYIDASWNEAWTGTTQPRQFKIDGKTLQIKTLSGQKSTITGREVVIELVWTKVS